LHHRSWSGHARGASDGSVTLYVIRYARTGHRGSDTTHIRHIAPITMARERGGGTVESGTARRIARQKWQEPLRATTVNPQERSLSLSQSLKLLLLHLIMGPFRKNSYPSAPLWTSNRAEPPIYVGNCQLSAHRTRRTVPRAPRAAHTTCSCSTHNATVNTHICKAALTKTKVLMQLHEGVRRSIQVEGGAWRRRGRGRDTTHRLALGARHLDLPSPPRTHRPLGLCWKPRSSLGGWHHR